MATTDDDVDTRDRYHTALACIAEQTSETQPPGVRTRTVITALVAHGPYSSDGIHGALQAARNNGDVVRWRDAEGVHRYTLAAEPDLRRAATHAGEQQLQTAVAKLNRAIAELRHDD